jgi:hypothetical protein
LIFSPGAPRGLTPETLFTFTQVVMVRCVDRLRYRQVKVSVVGVSLGSEVAGEDEAGFADASSYQR